jgi:hypothetical protein
MQHPLIRVSYLSFLTTFRLTADTMSLFVSPMVPPAPAMLNAPSYLEKGREYQAQPGLYPPKSQHSPEQPAATGPVTAQPSPQELYHPLARENRQGEGHGVQLPSSDIRNPVLRTRSSENRTSFWC